MWHGSVDVLLGPHPSTAVAVYAHPEDGADADGSVNSFEEKDSINLDSDRPQIISEAIVFAFLQMKCNPTFETFLIPTVGISKKEVVFYLYDPEHDILLESPPFILFTRFGKLLSYPTVLALWLILNYKTFCTGITKAMKIRNFTADFLSGVSSEVKTIYKEHLQFSVPRFVVVTQRYEPNDCEGWEVIKSEPFNERLIYFRNPP